MTVSTNDIHIIGGRADQGLLKSVEYCEPGVVGQNSKISYPNSPIFRLIAAP